MLTNSLIWTKRGMLLVYSTIHQISNSLTDLYCKVFDWAGIRTCALLKTTYLSDTLQPPRASASGPWTYEMPFLNISANQGAIFLEEKGQ